MNIQSNSQLFTYFAVNTQRCVNDRQTITDKNLLIIKLHPWAELISKVFYMGEIQYQQTHDIAIVITRYISVFYRLDNNRQTSKHLPCKQRVIWHLLWYWKACDINCFSRYAAKYSFMESICADDLSPLQDPFSTLSTYLIPSAWHLLSNLWKILYYHSVLQLPHVQETIVLEHVSKSQVQFKWNVKSPFLHLTCDKHQDARMFGTNRYSPQWNSHPHWSRWCCFGYGAVCSRGPKWRCGFHQKNTPCLNGCTLDTLSTHWWASWKRETMKKLTALCWTNYVNTAF